jgi:hypothetical protein
MHVADHRRAGDRNFKAHAKPKGTGKDGRATTAPTVGSSMDRKS